MHPFMNQVPAVERDARLVPLQGSLTDTSSLPNQSNRGSAGAVFVGDPWGDEIAVTPLDLFNVKTTMDISAGMATSGAAMPPASSPSLSWSPLISPVSSPAAVAKLSGNDTVSPPSAPPSGADPFLANAATQPVGPQYTTCTTTNEKRSSLAFGKVSSSNPFASDQVHDSFRPPAYSSEESSNNSSVEVANANSSDSAAAGQRPLGDQVISTSESSSKRLLPLSSSSSSSSSSSLTSPSSSFTDLSSFSAGVLPAARRSSSPLLLNNSSTPSASSSASGFEFVAMSKDCVDSAFQHSAANTHATGIRPTATLESTDSGHSTEAAAANDDSLQFVQTGGIFPSRDTFADTANSTTGAGAGTGVAAGATVASTVSDPIVPTGSKVYCELVDTDVELDENTNTTNKSYKKSSEATGEQDKGEPHLTKNASPTPTTASDNDKAHDADNCKNDDEARKTDNKIIIVTNDDDDDDNNNNINKNNNNKVVHEQGTADDQPQVAEQPCWPSQHLTNKMHVPQMIFTEATLLSTPNASTASSSSLTMGMAGAANDSITEGSRVCLLETTPEDNNNSGSQSTNGATVSDTERAGDDETTKATLQNGRIIADTDPENGHGERVMRHGAIVGNDQNYQHFIRNSSVIHDEESLHMSEVSTRNLLSASSGRRASLGDEPFPDGGYNNNDDDNCQNSSAATKNAKLRRSCSTGALRGEGVEAGTAVTSGDSPQPKHSRVFTSSPILVSETCLYPEPMQRWREEFRQRIVRHERQEEAAIEALRAEAKFNLNQWYAKRQEEIQAKHSVHLENEASYHSAHGKDATDAASLWKRIASLAMESQGTHRPDETNKDLSRMRGLLQLLGSRPPLKRVEVACADR